MLSTEHSLQPSADVRAIFNPKGRQTLLYVFFFYRSSITRLFYCLSVIINYDFDLSVSNFSISGVKIGQFVIIRHVIKYSFIR